MSLLGKAIAMASTGFVNKTDKGGKPYILHCFWVMNECNAEDEDELIAAMLHDVIEDGIYTWEEIHSAGFSHKVIELLVLLTHKKGTSYEDYIDAIAVSPAATRIKRADLRHNSDITRLKGMSKSDVDRMKKYHRAYTTLLSV